jgi:hypothetical protein
MAEKSEKIVKKTPTPYDLNSNDNPGILITQVQLKGENYDEWSRAIRTSLRARRKWGFVEGTIEQPKEGSSDLEDWWTVQSMLVSWVLNTVEPNLRSTISYQENVKQLWEDIKERLSISNGPRIQQIKMDLAECRQTGMTMVAYYGKLKSLWDELANYQQVPICTCSGCTCDVKGRMEKQREEEKVHQFLMGLDDVIYGTVRSNLLATDPLPKLNRVYATLVQEERVRAISRGKEERAEVVGFSAQVRGRSKGLAAMKDKDPVCSNCNRSGHEAEGCFQLVGYPEWWGDRPRGESGGRGRGRQRGGYASGRGRNGNVRANAAHINGETSTAMNIPNNNALPGLSNDQWQTLVNLLNNHKVNENDKMTGKDCEWIIDTGASNHMTGNIKLLQEMREITGCPVGLPDGKQVLATKEGSVILDGGLQIDNVLYVPKLSCNLISIPQLTVETKCVVHFTDTLCVMQDHTSKMLIGAGKQRDGLYFFKGIRHEKAHKASGICHLNLWHQRMGHPSFKITRLASGVGNKSSELENKACDVCFRAKQTRDVFPLSNHNATSSFDLIHCDLWGPYRTPSSCGASYFLTIMDDFSRAIWIYLLIDKREVSRTLIDFFALVERQFDKRVKMIRSDNGTEFICLKNYFREHGIVFQTSCSGTPQQNGRVERKH